MTQISAFIFDLDGVITDTSEFHYLAWRHLADDEGIPFSRAENEQLRGVSRRESLRIMLNGREISEETAQTWMERKNNYYIDLVKTLSPASILPGVIEFLKEIRAKAGRSAIASSSKNAPLVIEKLELAPFFDAIIDGTVVTKSKPAPDLFLRAGQELGAIPSQSIVFEDAAAGIEAGKAAGMYTVGLGPKERVGRADLVIPDLKNANVDEIIHGLISA